MTVKVSSGGALRLATAISIQVGGVLRPVRSIRIRIAGVLQTVFTSAGGLSVSVSPPTAVGTGPIGSTITTATATATPSGGTGPYTYSWVQTAHTGDTVTILAPTFASTAFRQTYAGDPIDTCDGTVTVTDALGGTASASFHASFRYTGP